MNLVASLTPAQHLGNLARIVTVLLDREACADRALQLLADLDALAALTRTSELAREVQAAVAARLNAESKEDEAVREPLFVLAHVLARDVAREVEHALVLAGANGGVGEMPAPELENLRRALALEARDER